jgi:hypothetical protein
MSSILVPDGRTPTLVISGLAGSVTMVNEEAPYPFPGVESERVVQDRQTRQSSVGPGKTIEVFRPWEGSEESLSFTATLPRAKWLTLRALHRANPPTVTVSYQDESWTGTLRRLSAPPDELSDEHDVGLGPREYTVSGFIKRSSD